MPQVSCICTCLANRPHYSLADNPQIYRNLSKITALARLGFIAAVTLLAAGSGMVGHSTGRILTVAGNAMFAIILAGLIIIELVIWRKSSILIPHTKKVCHACIMLYPAILFWPSCGYSILGERKLMSYLGTYPRDPCRAFPRCSHCLRASWCRQGIRPYVALEPRIRQRYVVRDPVSSHGVHHAMLIRLDWPQYTV